MDICIARDDDIRRVLDLRVEVFVGEQGVPRDIELDSEDLSATHVIAKEDGVIMGCARLLLGDNDAHIGRIAVKKEYRCKGVGSKLCQWIINYCRQNGYNNIWLNSQLQAVGFYQRIGFKSEGEVFIEAGIEHVKMVM